MCSACSGNYSGDYDDYGEYPANVGAAGVRPGEMADAQSDAVDAEPAYPLRGASDRPFKVRGSRWESDGARGEDWVVLVSEDEIIEIRFLRAQVCGRRGSDAT